MGGDQQGCGHDDAVSALSWRFVLVEPATAENVGAAARALKTMGVGSLWLVNPQCDPLGEAARYVAHGSNDVLEAAKVFSSLEELRPNVDLCIATSADQRAVRKTLVPAEELTPKLAAQGLGQRVALVFGRERRGLTNEEMESCDWVSALGMAQKHPTLNLAQAVMLYAYLIARHGPVVLQRRQRHLDAEPAEYRSLRELCCALLPKIGVKSENRAYRKLLGRVSHLGIEDVRLMFYLCRKLEQTIAWSERSQPGSGDDQ